jgi:hypothetical protein
VSTVKVNAITDASGGNTATINSMTPTADSLQGFRNRIINGDMRIDQRNAGASVTLTSGGVYPVDRWRCDEFTDGGATGEQVQDAPAGFVDSLKITTTTADGTLSAAQNMLINQFIEGFNTSDFGFGTANAKTITLSFWVKSSLTGTFAGGCDNNDNNRSYVFNYTISSANTWEYKTVTIAGDTSGTWLTTNSRGISVRFALGAGTDYDGTVGAWQSGLKFSSSGATSVIGTLNATWYITGVQLEVGSVATPFERRDYGRELALCQRYYWKTLPDNAGAEFCVAYGTATTNAAGIVFFPASMRIAPTALEQTGTAGDYRVFRCGAATNTTCSSVPVFGKTTPNYGSVTFTVASGLTNGSAGSLATVNTSAYLAWSAEL